MTNEELVERIQHGINAPEYLGQLYIQNEGFIATVIRKYRYTYRSDNKCIPIIEKNELMHEAYFGLIEAARRFDPGQGNTFLTYAAYWINQAVKRFLDNSGKVIRVPVHTQEKIYKYNQTTTFFQNRYGREPEKREYASYIGISQNEVGKLERFMFRGMVRSLDETIPGGENENLSFADAVPADTDIEEDVVEKLAAAQIREQLWNIVDQVLKDEKMIKVIRYRCVECITLDCAGTRMGITREMVRQYEAKALKRLRCNSRTKDLGEELGLWCREIPIDAHRVKRCTTEGELQYLNKRELKYAANMGWINSGAV